MKSDGIIATMTDKEKKRASFAKWYAKNKDYFIEWRKRNPEKVLLAAAKWREGHPSEHKKASAKWIKNNPDKVSAMNRDWRKRNPGKVTAKWHTRRARKQGSGGKLSTNIRTKLLLKQNNKCAICKTDLRKSGHHLDHVMPLALGGKNEDRNIQLTCPPCNLRKQAKDPIRFMREMGYLL